MAASTGGISGLGPDKLGELFSKLYPVRAKWYNLGLGLGISCNDLDAIKKDCKEDTGECLKGVLKLWLRSQHPGIADLIESLSKQTVGEGQLAKELHVLTWSTSSPSIDTIPSPPNCSSIQSEEPKDFRAKSSPLLSDSMTQTDVVSTSSPDARPYARNVKVEDFKFLIRQDLKKLKEEFITLQFNIRESLTVKVSPEKITAHVLADYANVHESSESERAVSLFNDRDKERLHSPTSVNEIFEVLQKYWSFVKCEMLFSIAKHCGDESDHVKVREYQGNLKTFFENRKLSEIPEELLSSNSVDELHEKLLIKLDRDDPCWKDIEEFEFKICEILEIMPSALVIVGFRQGCVELCFNIPRHIAQIIFHEDLSSAQQEKLKALFVLTLSCGGFHATIADVTVRRYYFHIEGGEKLILTSNEDSNWHEHVENEVDTSDVHCQKYSVQCEKPTILKREQRIHPDKLRCLKEPLRRYLKLMEKNQSRCSFRFEARFGHLIFTDSHGQYSPLQVIPCDLLKRNDFKKNFITRLHNADTEKFLQENCTCCPGVSTDLQDIKSTYKIKFTFEYEQLNGVCYVEERCESFTLRPHSIQKSTSHTNEMKIDIIRPGRTYDFRVVACYQTGDVVPVDMNLKRVAEKIRKSMERHISSYEPGQKELYMQLVGEDFHVNYVRETRKKEHKWKTNTRWILADYNVKEFTMTEKTRKILKRDQQFRAIPLPYDTVKKEIELWSRSHDPPQDEKWTTEELLSTNHFDEFVGTCFEIASKLDADIPHIN